MGGMAAVIAAGDVPDGHALSRMLAPVPHRGTEHEIIKNGRTSLGVVRGSDRQDSSLEMADGIAVAFTGILDNGAELAASVGSGPGGPLPSPARLIAEGFRRFGDDFASRLRGAYAVIVSDGHRLVCFRDHLGLESLFYRRDSAGCWVASEAKQVVAGAGIPREPNLDVVERIFFQASADAAMPSALRGVDRLPGRTILTTDGRMLGTHTYWDPTSLLETARPSVDELQGRFDELMTQAARRMVTGDDVVSLSGGIDSPAVAAYTAPVHLERAGTPLRALTLVYPDHPSVDERRYAELVAERLGIPFHPFVPRARPLDHLEEWVTLVDGPLGVPSLGAYEELYGHARSLGARTVLFGEWAELVTDGSRGLLLHLLAHGRFGPLWRQFRERRARGVSGRALARLVLSPLATPVTARWWGRQDLFVPAWVDLKRVKEAAVSNIPPPTQTWRRAQLDFFDHPHVAIEADAICQQRLGVRGRRPWTDIDLWEFFLSLPAEMKFPPAPVRKSLVRQMLRGKVPDTILDRRDKTDFRAADLGNVDYAALDRWVIDSPCRIAGVDYPLLAERLRARPPEWIDYRWARSLASVHAFLSTC